VYCSSNWSLLIEERIFVSIKSFLQVIFDGFGYLRPSVFSIILNPATSKHIYIIDERSDCKDLSKSSSGSTCLPDALLSYLYIRIRNRWDDLLSAEIFYKFWILLLFRLSYELFCYSNTWKDLYLCHLLFSRLDLWCLNSIKYVKNHL